MVDPQPPNALSTYIEPAKRELAALVETGLVTAEQQRSLAVATTNLERMKAFATPAEGRHFKAIDTMLAVRGNSPIAQARELLAGLAGTWDGLSEDFHRFKKLHLEAKLLRARLAKRRQDLGAITDDIDRDVAAAEIDLDEARAAELEAQVARGAAALKGRIEKATASSEQYQVILKEAGKTEFTEADFRGEEIDYYVKTAWWHAVQIYQAVDTRDKWSRDYDGAGNPHGDPPKGLHRDEMREYEGVQRRKAKKHQRIMIKSEAILYFQALGITETEVQKEIAALLAMRESFDLSTAVLDQGRDFTPLFDNWLVRMVATYRTRAASTISSHGDARLKRIATLLDPDAEDAGGRGDMQDMSRRSGIR